MFRVNDPFFRSYEKKKYNVYKVKNARIFTDNNENVAVIKNNILISKLSFQQINGKLKDRIEVASDLSEEEIQDLALASERVKELLNSQKPKRIIVRPPALINIVV